MDSTRSIHVKGENITIYKKDIYGERYIRGYVGDHYNKKRYYIVDVTREHSPSSTLKGIITSNYKGQLSQKIRSAKRAGYIVTNPQLVKGEVPMNIPVFR